MRGFPIDTAALVGRQFGRWTALSVAPSKGKAPGLLCRCACGTEKRVTASNLTGGHSTACRRCAVQRHGATRGGRATPEHQAWADMQARCAKPSHPSYADYGARGICVAPEWIGEGGFERFLAHVGQRPGRGYSLDRIDNDGNYAPGNVRWATRAEQARNTRATRLVTIDGRTQCLAAWVEESPVPKSTIFRRLGVGWPVERALFAPPRRRAA